MPELPEVETVRRSLLDELVGRTITRVELANPKFARYPDPAELEAALPGQTITGLSRRGKYLIIQLGDELDLVIHLKMAGRLLISDPAAERVRHTHIILGLDNGHELRYVDLRHFGGFYLVARGDYRVLKGLYGLGPEPLRPGFTASYLKQCFASRKSKIKNLLLDQSVIAGLGNIYADEALYRSGISPLREAGSLGDREIERLHRVIEEVIAEAIEHRGTTFATYVDGQGRRGRFAERLQAYGRQGEPCLACGRPLVRVKIGGRSAHYCPDCQR
ncbi:MAG: bifunctional DNA-formamidopyrimidine glycosylase/DNA-(apurinic or apyrimidinic site) lyase [Bacillota bacterium]